MDIKLTNDQVSTIKASLLYSRFQLQNELHRLGEGDESRDAKKGLAAVNELIPMFTKTPAWEKE